MPESRREEINRIYEKEGLDALWKWAKGHPDRWEALKDWAGAKAKQFRDELDHEREQIEKDEEDLHRLGEKIAELRDRRAKNDKAMAEAKEDGDEKRIAELESRSQEIDREVKKTLAAIERNEVSEKKNRRQAHDDKRKALAWVERKIVYREKWEKAIERQKSKGGGFDNAEWEDWMAHGLDSNVTALVKKILAWGVLDYDLTVTSMRRTYVPPGGSTTSYHLQTPGRAGDIAGPRMAEFQQAVYEKFKGNAAILELFGPVNNLCLKYGAPLSMAEGTGLENLHDTHVHVAA